MNLEPYRVEVFHLIYHRRLTPSESPLGGWKYSKPSLGIVEVQATGIEHAEEQALKQFPKGNAVHGWFWQLGAWQSGWASNFQPG
jgi:hypothetical protein